MSIHRQSIRVSTEYQRTRTYTRHDPDRFEIPSARAGEQAGGGGGGGGREGGDEKEGEEAAEAEQAEEADEISGERKESISSS